MRPPDPPPPTDLASARAVLASHGARVREDWIAQCAAFVRQELGARAPQQSLQDGVWLQFLHSDLRTTFPQGTASPLSTSKIENAIVQTTAVSEVGSSAWSQLAFLRDGAAAACERQARAVTLDDVEAEADAEVHPSRGRQQLLPARFPQVALPRGMLRITLTDGVREIEAMEYRPIQGVHLLTPLGCKLRVHGARVEGGVLFLEPSTVTVLGGQVRSLYAAGADNGDFDLLRILELEAQLERTLGLAPGDPRSVRALVSSGRLGSRAGGHVGISGEATLARTSHEPPPAAPTVHVIDPTPPAATSHVTRGHVTNQPGDPAKTPEIELIDDGSIEWFPDDLDVEALANL